MGNYLFQVFYEEREPAVVEPIRTVPLAYRQPTSQVNRDALLGNVRYKPSRGTAGAADEEKKVGTTRNYSVNWIKHLVFRVEVTNFKK